MTTESRSSSSMLCRDCGRTNLPGGLRCAYCGALFPAIPQYRTRSSDQPASTPQTKAKRGGVAGSLFILLAKIKSIFVFLKMGSILLTLSTMLISFKVYAHFYGWKFGLGILLSIFFHEMGHVAVNKAKGLKSSAPVFLPLMGAVIFLKNFPDNPTFQSESGAGGPVAGGITAFICLLVGLVTHSPFWFGLANFGFLMNLFNLTPFPPLDGSHISTVFSPRIWNIVLITVFLFAVKVVSPILWAILIIGVVMRMGAHSHNRYLLALPNARVRMAAVYVLLCITLSLGYQFTNGYQSYLIPNHYEHASQGYAHQSTQLTAPPEEARQRSNPEMALAIASILMVISSLLWLGSTLLLARASYRSVNFKILLFPLIALFLNGLYIAAFATIPAIWNLHGAVSLVEMTMALTAFVYAVWSSAYRDRLQAPASYLEYAGRALLWAMAGGLMTAYAFGRPIMVILPLLTGIMTLLCMLWLPYSLLAEYYSNLKDNTAMAKYVSQALKLPLPPENRRVLITLMAQAALTDRRGSKALSYLEQTVDLPGSALQDIHRLQLSVLAYMLQEDYPKALAGLEAMLRTQSSEALLQVYIILADMARHREWYDDAEERLRMLLSMQNNSILAVSNGLRLDLVTTLLDANKLTEAEEELKILEKQPLEAPQRRTLGVVRAMIAVKQGRKDEAAALMKQAGMSISSLEDRYRLARLQDELGDKEAQGVMKQLEEAYPDETWGMRASRFLRGEPAPPAAEHSPIAFEF